MAEDPAAGAGAGAGAGADEAIAGLGRLRLTTGLTGGVTAV